MPPTETLNLADTIDGTLRYRRKIVVTRTFWVRFLAELDDRGKIYIKDW